jgi:hypothetical protein
MAATLSAASRTRLAKLLGMLGSDHAGERDSAGLAAHRLVQQSGLTWQQVVSPPPAEHKLPELGTWRTTVRECLEHPGSLRPWERTFLADLPKFQRLSTKQRYCLKTIADRVLQRGAA